MAWTVGERMTGRKRAAGSGFQIQPMNQEYCPVDLPPPRLRSFLATCSGCVVRMIMIPICDVKQFALLAFEPLPFPGKVIRTQKDQQ
jgi:hypothetical protein